MLDPTMNSEKRVNRVDMHILRARRPMLATEIEGAQWKLRRSSLNTFSVEKTQICPSHVQLLVSTGASDLSLLWD